MDDDYEDYSYYSKPRLQLARGAVSRKEEEEVDDSLGRPVKIASCSLGVAFIALGLYTEGYIQFAVFWVALGFLVGPFAPRKVTGGDCRVGEGEELELEEGGELVAEESAAKASSSVNGKDGRAAVSAPLRKGLPPAPKQNVAAQSKAQGTAALGKGEWAREEWDQLRKMMVKFPRGTPQRWEAVARSLGTKRSTEEIISVSKFMQESNEKDPYAAFAALNKSSWDAEREAKALSAATVDAISSASIVTAEGSFSSVSGTWTAAQEKGLLQALKEIPKDTPQRWDKIAASVGAHSRADCMKHYSEMKESFKAKKAGTPSTEVVLQDD